MTNKTFVALLLGSLAMLTGCAGNAPARLYVLTAQPGTVVEPVADVVSVGPVAVRDYLNRSQLVTFDADHRLVKDGNNEWGEPLVRNITQVLVRNLAQRLDSERVINRGGLTGVKPVYQVAVEINELAAKRNGEVLLVASWSLKNTRTKTSQVAVASHQTQVNSNSAADRVVAQSQLLGQLADAIAAAIAAQP